MRIIAIMTTRGPFVALEVLHGGQAKLARWCFSSDEVPGPERRRRGARGAPRRSVPVPQSRTQLDGIQSPGSRRSPGPASALAGAVEVPGNLQFEPRRVLHGAR